jgi:vitamin B12/bleomycin/antimicrobial peptide transport system ATP-binding/permease protein
MTMDQESAPRFAQKQLYARFWRFASGFWNESPSWVVRSLTISLIILVAVQLIVQYRLNLWNRDFFDALQQRSGSGLWKEALLFLPLAASSITLSIISVWGRMMAQRKWRAWLTTSVIDYWLAGDHYRRLDQVGGEHQNPEFRIAEDSRIATDAPIDLALGLLTSLLTAATFIVVLWEVGGALAVNVFGRTVSVPGYLVIAVVAYSFLFTSAMRVIGRNLTHVIEGKNQAEAEFLSEAARLAEVGESLMPMENRERERRALASALANVLEYWLDLCKELMRTTLVSQGNFLLAPVVGWILCAPKFLVGTMTLGELTQAAAAFVIVQGAFNWLVDNYQRFADWTSSVNRVAYLLFALDEIAKHDELEVASASMPRFSAFPDKMGGKAIRSPTDRTAPP